MLGLWSYLLNLIMNISSNLVLHEKVNICPEVFAEPIFRNKHIIEIFRKCIYIPHIYVYKILIMFTHV